MTAKGYNSIVRFTTRARSIHHHCPAPGFRLLSSSATREISAAAIMDSMSRGFIFKHPCLFLHARSVREICQDVRSCQMEAKEDGRGHDPILPDTLADFVLQPQEQI